MNRPIPVEDRPDVGDDMQQDERTEQEPTGPGSQRARLDVRAWESQTAAARRAAQDRPRD